MKFRIRNISGRMVSTVRSTPAESLLVLAFLVYGFVTVVSGDFDENAEYGVHMWLFPFGFTLAYVLNRLLPSGARRTVYYLSPLAVLPFFWVDMRGWPGTASFLTALGLCPVAVQLLRSRRRDNAGFVADAVRYIKNALFAAVTAGVAHLAVVGIYYSLRYIFPGLPLGDEDKLMLCVALFFWVGAMPMVFLALDRGEDRPYSPVRLADATINYVLTPALMLYTAILYAYFVKVAVAWSLPEGGVANMVFVFAMVAVAVKAYLPLMARRMGGWFYDRFSVISLPALAMFWIGAARRVNEYGLTEWRVYMFVCGGLMTLTVLMFLVPRVAAYRWPATVGAALFALFAFVPGITATEIGVASQQRRFDAVAARLGILDGEGRLIVAKRPRVTDEQQKDYGELYDAFRYVNYRTDSAAMMARFGVADLDGLTELVMPDNMPYGTLRPHENLVYLYRTGPGLDADISGYASMHGLTHEGNRDGPSYTERTDSLRMTIISPNGDTLLSTPMNRIFDCQLARAGLDHTATEGELKDNFNKMALYEEGGYAVLFEFMYIAVDDGLKITDASPSLLFVRE